MFAYYYFFRICEWCKRNVFESSFPSVDMKGLKKVKFPIPPRDVQEEIVRVLDRFTELETELEAELEARQKQYAYYRDLLLTFPDDAVTYLPLGEVCETVTDFTAAGSFASNANNVKYLKAPDYALMVRTTDLKQSFSNSESFVFVDEHAFSYLWRVNLDTESIILPNVGNCGEVYFTIPKDLPHTHCVLGPNALLLRSRNAMNKYLYYWFQSLDFQRRLLKITSKTGQSKFNKTNLKKIPIPIPSLEEQERIVGILDRFETLAHSITEGLPRELELRREQYSYYRDLLLDFPHQD